MTVTKTLRAVMVLLVLGGLTAAALAAAEPDRPTTQAIGTKEADTTPAWAKAVARIGACIGAALAAAGGGYGVSRIGSGCIESIARQPEAARDMFAPMVVAAGMVEVGMLFAIVVALLCVVLA